MNSNYKLSSDGVKLSEINFTNSISYLEYKDIVEELQDKMNALSHYAHSKKRTSVLVFEGWDAAGKGGSIRRLTSKIDPRLYKVTSIAAPTEVFLVLSIVILVLKIVEPEGSSTNLSAI